MKRLASVLTLVLVISMTIGVCPVGAAGAEDFTREDAVTLFEKAMEYCRYMQGDEGFFAGNERNEALVLFHVVPDTGEIIAPISKKFDASTYGEKYNQPREYSMINPNHKYGSWDKIKAWGESIFTARMASEIMMYVVFYPNRYEEATLENLRIESDGTLWIDDHVGTGFFGYRNCSDFSVDGNHAVLKLEGRKGVYGDDWYDTEVKFVKTSNGWRVAPSEFFIRHLTITSEYSPETGDGTAARAAVFAAGAVLAAAVPALMLASKRRREET